MLKSKVHNLQITEANINYKGSITLPKELIKKANFRKNEQVHVLDITNGTRIVTYILEGPEGFNGCCINGAAARLVQPGDRVIILSYAYMTPEEADHHEPLVLVINE